MLYEHLVFPLVSTLTSSDAEKAHTAGLQMLKFCGKKPLRTWLSNITRVNGNETEAFGLKFPSPIGLAAGFEKNATALHGLCALNPGFIEVGTIVPEPQTGNPRPRMFRLREDEALINRLGFNSHGVMRVKKRLEWFQVDKPEIPIGINVGANKNTERFYQDYVIAISLLYALADYITINISSPNTPGLRDLQHGERLETLLAAVSMEMKAQASFHGKKPLLLKVAPDLTLEGLDEICNAASGRISGLIIGNTTLGRDNLHSEHSSEMGGLSGKPLFRNMLKLVQHVVKHSDIPVVAAGGINCGEKAAQALDEGACLVQALTGFVYKGPMFFRNANRYLVSSAAH